MAIVHIECPRCGAEFRVADSQARGRFECTVCGAGFRAEAPRVAPAADSAPMPVAEPAPRYEIDIARPRRGMSRGLLWALIGVIGLAALAAVVAMVVLSRPGNERANADNFKKIRQGMSEKEVIAIMGPPTRTMDLGFVKSLGWTTPTHDFSVSLMNDQVAMTMAMERNGQQPVINFGGGNMAGGNIPNLPNINLPNFNDVAKLKIPNVKGGRDWTKLKSGMTEKEVLDQFGQPVAAMDCDGPKLAHAGVTEKEVRAAHNGQLPPVKLLSYMDLSQVAQYKVTLVDGKVFKVRKQ